MSDIIYESGLEYWRIHKRYNQHRKHAGMRPVAVMDMINLLPRTASEAVRRRIHGFINRHSERPPTPPKRTA